MKMHLDARLPVFLGTLVEVDTLQRERVGEAKRIYGLGGGAIVLTLPRGTFGQFARLTFDDRKVPDARDHSNGSRDVRAPSSMRL